MDCLSVVSLNVRGLHNSSKRHTVYRWLKSHDHMMSGSKEVGVETYFIVFQTQPIVRVYL